jgi:hypothetical protein
MYVDTAFIRKLRLKKMPKPIEFRDVRFVSAPEPTVFEARTTDDRPVYVHCRSNWLTVEIGERGDSGDALPGLGFEVYEEQISASDMWGDERDWGFVLECLSKVDLLERLELAKQKEMEYLAHWRECYQSINKLQLPAVTLWTLALSAPVWRERGGSRIGQLDFDSGMAEYCQNGVFAYVFKELKTQLFQIVVTVSVEHVDQWRAADLVMEASKAFGGALYGVTDGSYCARITGCAHGEEKEAFQLIASKLQEI